MKRAAIFLGVAFALALVTILVAPSFVNWNTYRGQLARAISEAAGREVTIGGDLDLAVLPSPYLSARSVRVANVEGAVEPDMIRMAELRLRLAVAPLLRGLVSLTSVTLVEPEIALETTPQGRSSWSFAKAEDGLSGSPDGSGRPFRAPFFDIAVERIAIIDGVLAWRRAGGAAERLDALDAEIRSSGPASGYRVSGKTRYRDIPLTFTGIVGRIAGDTPVPVTATFALPEGAATLKTTLRLNATEPNAVGSIELTAASAAAMARAVRPGMAATLPDRPLTIESALEADGQRIDLAELKLRLGETTGEGTVAVDLAETPMVTAAIAFPMFDLDSLLAAADSASDGEDRAAASQPESTIGAGFPTGVTARLEFSADRIRLRGGLLRDGRLSASLEEGTVALSNAAARLPGGTNVSVSGTATAGEGGIGFTGELAAAADNLRAALVWTGIEDAVIPRDRLRGFSFTSGVAVTPETVQLTDITARLDATRMTGGVAIARRSRPSFGLRLSLDRLNLDDYLPVTEDAADRLESTGAGSEAGDSVFGKFDANVDISVDTLSWRGETARNVRLDGRIFKGDATVRSLSASDLAGAAIELAGRLDRLSGTPTGDFDVSVDGRDPTRFARLLGVTDGGAARQFGRFAIEGHVTGTVERLMVDGTMKALGGNIAAEGHVASIRSDPSYELAVSLEGAEGGRLLALAAPETDWRAVGPVSGGFDLSGSAERLALRNLDISVADMPVTGTVDADFSGERPKLSATLAGGHLQLDRFLSDDAAGQDGAGPKVRGSARWSREEFDLSPMQRIDLDLSLALASLQRTDLRMNDVDVRAGLAGGRLTVDRLTASAFDGRLDMSGSIDASGPVPQFTARVDGSDLEAEPAFGALFGFDRLQGSVTTHMVLSASGASELHLVSSLSGTATLAGRVRARLTREERTRAGVAGLAGALLGDKIREAGLASDALVSLLRGFADAPADLQGDIAIEGGQARTENLTLDGTGARAVTVGTADLANWRIESTTTLRRDADGDDDPYMVVRLRGPLDEPDIRSSGTWLRQPRAVPSPAVETQPQPTAPDAPAVQPAEPAPKPEEPPKPEQFILDILKSLSD